MVVTNKVMVAGIHLKLHRHNRIRKDTTLLINNKTNNIRHNRLLPKDILHSPYGLDRLHSMLWHSKDSSNLLQSPNKGSTNTLREI